MSRWRCWWISILTACALLSSCGDEKAKYDVEQKVSGVTWPTKQNFDSWKKHWDNRSWIVALSREHQQLKRNSFFRTQLIQSFENQIVRYDASFTGFSELKYRISNLTLSHILAVSNFEKQLLSGAQPLPVFGFATVSFRGGPGGLEQLLFVSPMLQNKISSLDDASRSRFLLNFMWDTLEGVPGVEFAEPDLESEVLRDPAYVKNVMTTAANLKDLGLADLVDKMSQSGQALVAVLDTGVDNDLDNEGKALAGRLFKNAGEKPGDGIDNDGNGWVDDYMGVDATIPKGESDFSPKPIPGSSDVGGAGVACETDGVRNFSSCGHGSHVAGIVAGFSVTSDPFVGVCPYNCQILPIRAARRCFSPKGRSDGECELASEAPSFNPATMREFNGGIPDSAQLRGLSYVLDLESPTSPGKLATNIVNLSIGRYFSSRSLSLISRRVVQNDILMVAAAGNQNVEVPMFPAAYKDVVAVCATSIDEEFAGGNKEPNGSGDPSQSFPVRGKRLKARFSNFGDWVDICAPGSSILSSKPGANTGTESGTSQASPHVSGVAGMLKAFQPGLSALELRAVLIKYADFDFLYGTLPNGKLANEDFAFSPYPDIKVFLLGSGFLSAGRAYKALFEPSTVQESQASYAIESGDTSQVTSGCVVSSLAAGNKLKPIEVTTSMPISLLFAWLLLHLTGIRRKRPGR